MDEFPKVLTNYEFSTARQRIRSRISMRDAYALLGSIIETQKLLRWVTQQDKTNHKNEGK